MSWWLRGFVALRALLLTQYTASLSAYTTWAPQTRGARGAHVSRHQHNLAIGARFNDRVVRLGRVCQWEFLADDRP